MAEAKASKMKQKTEELRRGFPFLPQSEVVIQDYFCSWSLIQGRMYLTQNYLCFYANIIGQNISIPYMEIDKLAKSRNALMIDNAISIDKKTGENLFFSSFVHRDETFNLIEHLWKYPVYMIEEVPEISSNSSSSTEQPHYNNSSPFDNPFTTSSKEVLTSSQNRENLFQNTPSSSASSSNNKSNSQSLQQQELMKSDKSLKNALRMANESQTIGMATLNELQNQADQIDRIENNIEKIHANMDHAERLIRGMNIVGAVQNRFSSPTSSAHFLPQSQSRNLHPKIEKPPMDIPILEKNQNDFLNPTILRLIEDKFMCIDPATKQAKNNEIWAFDRLESLIIRTRPLHLDIRFKGNIPRFRLCSSYIQAIVNEIFLRTKIDSKNVIFENGALVFHYGNPIYSHLKGKKEISSSSTSSNILGTGGFTKSAKPKSNLSQTVFKDASEDIKREIDEQEEDLDELDNMLGNLNAMASTMGSELDRQNKQLDRVNERTDLANTRIQNVNKKIDKKLK